MNRLPLILAALLHTQVLFGAMTIWPIPSQTIQTNATPWWIDHPGWGTNLEANLLPINQGFLTVWYDLGQITNEVALIEGDLATAETWIDGKQDASDILTILAANSDGGPGQFWSWDGGGSWQTPPGAGGYLPQWAGISTNGNVPINIAGNAGTATTASAGWPTTWAEADITGLTTDLGNKQSASTNLSQWAGIGTNGNVPINIAGTAGGGWPTNWPESAITGLTTDLAGKINKTGGSATNLTVYEGLTVKGNNLLLKAQDYDWQASFLVNGVGNVGVNLNHGQSFGFSSDAGPSYVAAGYFQGDAQYLTGIFSGERLKASNSDGLILHCPDGGSWIIHVGNDGTLTTATNSAGL